MFTFSKVPRMSRIEIKPHQLISAMFLTFVLVLAVFASSTALAGIAEQNATLTLQVSEVVNDNGGTAVISDFNLEYFSDSNWQGDAPTGDPLVTEVSVVPGFTALGVYAYSLGYFAGQWTCEVTPLEGQSEIVVTGYSIILESGDIAVCSVVVDDRPSYLTLEKFVTNDDGGEAVPSDWTLSATDSSDFVVLSGPGGEDGEVDAGEYQLAEFGGPVGYAASDWECFIFDDKGPNKDKDSTSGNIEVVDGVVVIANGEDVYCEITNDDTPPVLTLDKNVINDNGGTAVPSDFVLRASGQSIEITGAAGADEITDISLPIGVYTLSEVSGPNNYLWGSWDCGDGNLQGVTLTLALGDVVTCTVTNDDIPGRLQLIKELVLDNGGTADVSDWTLTATGTGSVLQGTSGIEGDVDAGQYQLSESGGPAGYTAMGWSCDFIGPDQIPSDSPNGESVPTEGIVNVGIGEYVSCTITNNDNEPGLTLVKVVAGGEALPADFALTLTGADGTHNSGTDYQSGNQPAVVAGVQYEVTEAQGQVVDYFLEGITCTDNADQSEIAQPFTLAVGQGITCTVTNNLNEVVIDLLTEACLNDTPYVNYDVTTTSGVAPDVTITWIKNDGSNEVVETLVDVPVAGQLLWPGAKVVNGVPVAWPGWMCDDQGENCVEVNDGLVPSMQLNFEINPTVTAVVNYPPVTPACAAIPPPPPPTADPVPIPVDNALALLLLTLLMMATGWYMRPAMIRKL